MSKKLFRGQTVFQADLAQSSERDQLKEHSLLSFKQQRLTCELLLRLGTVELNISGIRGQFSRRGFFIFDEGRNIAIDKDKQETSEIEIVRTSEKHVVERIQRDANGKKSEFIQKQRKAIMVPALYCRYQRVFFFKKEENTFKGNIIFYIGQFSGKLDILIYFLHSITWNHNL